MRSGKLRHRILIEKPSYSVGSVRRWATVAGNVPATVVAAEHGSDQQGNVREGFARFEISMRYLDGINNKMRLTWAGQRLYIGHASDPSHTRRELKIVAMAPDFEEVTLSRGDDFVTVGAVRVKSTFVEADTAGESVVTGNSVDWLIDAADYNLGESFITPAYGDRIILAERRAFAAQPFNGELWRFDDPQETFIRVHTIEVPQ